MTDLLQHIEDLGCPETIWAISTIDGDVQALNRVHEVIWREIQPDDKVIYHGNYLGNPARTDNPDAIDAINLFINALTTHNLTSANNIVCLKGQREELWLKTLQLQFAANPHNVLEWLLRQGMEGVLKHYGTSGAEGLAACRGGVIPLTRWTSFLRQKMYEKAGHAKFYQGLKRAALINPLHNENKSMLFVHSGIDPRRPLESQEDNFWWGGHKLNGLNHQYSNFQYIVRGFDPAGQGAFISDHIISLCGRKGGDSQIKCAKINRTGEMEKLHSF